MNAHFLVDVLQCVGIFLLAVSQFWTHRQMRRGIAVVLESAAQVIDLHQKWKREGSLLLWTRGKERP